MEFIYPPHPGEILREEFLKKLNTTVTQLARHLGISRSRLSRILRCSASINADLAVRLERAGISKARLWLQTQSYYDLWQAESREQPSVERYVRANS
jgi:addiction module HigA family antidote